VQVCRDRCHISSSKLRWQEDARRQGVAPVQSTNHDPAQLYIRHQRARLRRNKCVGASGHRQVLRSWLLHRSHQAVLQNISSIGSISDGSYKVNSFDTCRFVDAVDVFNVFKTGDVVSTRAFLDKLTCISCVGVIAVLFSPFDIGGKYPAFFFSVVSSTSTETGWPNVGSNPFPYGQNNAYQGYCGRGSTY